RLRERFRTAFAPVGRRKQRLIELPVGEGVLIALPVAWLDVVALRGRPPADTLVPVRPREGFVGRLARGRLQRGKSVAPLEYGRIHEVPAALAREQITFFDELLICQHDGVAGN